MALRLRCFLRGVWRDRSFGAVPRSARGVTERDVWMDLGDGGARDGAKVGVFRVGSACALRSVILRRDTMNFSLLGLLLLATSSRAILPVSVTLVEEQG